MNSRNWSTSYSKVMIRGWSWTRAKVPIIDSSGIGALVRSLTSAKQGGGSIKLVQPSKMVVQTLKMVGMLNIFEIFETDEEAVQSFG